MNTHRAKLAIGLGVHALILIGILGLLAAPDVREPGRRITSSLLSGLDAERASDLLLEVETVEGLEPGLPAFVIDEHGAGRPVAHVLTWTEGQSGGTVRLRLEPGERGTYRAHVFPPRRGLRDAYQLAVPTEVATRLGDELQSRLVQFWNDELSEDLASRLPAFFERIDPRGDNRTREVLDALGVDAFARIKPHLDDLVGDMTGAIAENLSTWEKLKVLGSFLGLGSARSMKKKLMPIAEEAAREWWAANRDEVLVSLGDALKERGPEIAQWIATDLADAVRDELIVPALAKHRPRLEAEGEALVRLVLADVIRVPAGGFQVRFAAMLRHVLLSKHTALLVLEPTEPA